MIDKIIKTVNQNYIKNLEYILQQGIEKCDNFNRFDDFIKYKDLSAQMHFLNEKVFTILFKKENKNSLIEVFYYKIDLNKSSFTINAVSFGNNKCKVVASNNEFNYYMIMNDNTEIDMISFTKDMKIVNNYYLEGLKKTTEENNDRIDFIKKLNSIAIHYPHDVFNYVFAGKPLSVEVQDLIELNFDVKIDYNSPKYKEHFLNIFDKNKIYSQPNNKKQ